TVLTQAVDMANGSGTLQFDLPPELFGTIELSAYRMGSAALPVRKARVLYVRRGGRLNVQAKLDQAEYRPGGRARLQLALTDPRGTPTPGAVGLAGVEEAVFNVLKQAPGMEGRFYLLEQELLKPVYAIYPWEPDLKTAVPEQQAVLEQALFSRTARTVGAPGEPAPMPRPPGVGAAARAAAPPSSLA